MMTSLWQFLLLKKTEVLNKNNLIGFKHTLISIYQGTGHAVHFHWVKSVFYDGEGGNWISKAKSYEHVGKICILSSAECLSSQKDGAFELILELHKRTWKYKNQQWMEPWNTNPNL